jgi:hypothetical protein
MESNDLYRSDNSGDSWIRPGDGLPESPYEVLAFEVHRGVPGILYEAGGWWHFDVFPPGFSRSTDFGASWTTPSVFPEVGLFAIPECVASDPVTGQTVYLWCSFGAPGYLFRSTDGGQTFDVLEEVPIVEAAVVSPIDPARIYAAHSYPTMDVRYSNDRGVTWSNWGTGLPEELTVALFLDSSDPFRQGDLSAQGSLVVVLRTLGAYRSTGPTAPWIPIDLPGYQDQPVIDCDYDAVSDRLAICTQSGDVYVTGEGFVSQGLTGRTVAIDPVSGSLLAGTDHRSVFRLDLEDVVDAGEISAPPSRSCSIAASPIPSRGTVNFSVTLVRDARVQVSIMDVRGRRVATVFDGALTRGTHALTWDSRSQGPVAAGVYFAKLEAFEDVASARIVLMND